MNSLMLFMRFIADSLKLLLRQLLPTGSRPAPSLWQRAVLLLVLPVFMLWQVINWIGLLTDELMFRGYHKVDPGGALYVLGIPRSGTTFLHRLLSEDKQFTTLSTWECLFAPSITQRKLIGLIAFVDRGIGRPLQRLLDAALRLASRRLDEIHSVSLEAAEEDYLLLLPVMASLILILPFPHEPAIRNLAFFDQTPDDRRKQRLLEFYRGMLQRHLYCHPGRRLLSKNAALLSWQPALRNLLPEANFVVCTRAPDEALASQLSALEPGIRIFGSDRQVYREYFVEVFEHYYELVLQLLGSASRENLLTVRNQALRSSLDQTVTNIYQQFALPLTTEFRVKLEEASIKAARFRSSHQYSLQEHRVSYESLKKLNQYYHSILLTE